jgi:hypothetical protein
MKRFALFLALILFSTTTLIASDLRSGLWSAQLDGDALHLNLVQPSRHEGWGQNNIGTRIKLAVLTGLSAADVNASAANVIFSLNAPAGTIAFDGRFSNGTGAGGFRFTPSDAFAREMESLGFAGGFKDEEMLMFAMHLFRPQTIRDLRALGYTIDKRQLDEIAVFRIDANYVKEIEAIGIAKPTMRELVDMRVGRVDGNFVKETRALFGDIPARQIAELGIMRVTPEYVRELQSAGLTRLTARQATDLKIGRITAAKIAEYKRLGYDLTPRQLADFGIHRITPEFIEEQRAAGEKDLTPERLIELRIFSRTGARRR